MSVFHLPVSRDQLSGLEVARCGRKIVPAKGPRGGVARVCRQCFRQWARTRSGKSAIAMNWGRVLAEIEGVKVRCSKQLELPGVHCERR